METTTIETEKDILTKAKEPHKIWSKFSKWIIRTFGKDLHGEWQFMEYHKENGRKSKVKYRSFNELELSRRLVGYDVMLKVETYIKKHCPEIRIVHCDDSVYASSNILLIPHPNHGITVIFIPQCTSVQNQMFLYERHFKDLMSALEDMKKVYKK